MSPDPQPTPPAPAEALLSSALPEGEIREGVLGDLHELFLQRVQNPKLGLKAARRWYWLQAIRLAVRFTSRRLRVRSQPSAPSDGVGALLRQLRFSFRSLLRSPGFSAPALLILAVGLTAVTTMFTVVDSVIFQPLDYPESERFVLVCEDHVRMGGACVASPGNAADLRAQSRSFSALGIGRGWSFSITDSDGRRGLRGGLATGSFFEALGVVPQVGRLFTEDEVGADRDNVLILSHGFWQDRYGADPAILGSTLTVEGEPAVVIGVLPRGFEAPLDLNGIEAWRPPHIDLLDPEFRGWRGWRTVGRLASGVSPESGAQELEGLYSRLADVHAEIDNEWRIQVRPLIDVVVGDTRPVFFAFLAAAGLLMVIVCANVTNLLLARGTERRRARSEGGPGCRAHPPRI
ncbi:MAG: ABC transporter permease [Gemmatimonadetes bacterium]|nr:ABC transporter permease [Gemmatimonadota bacterium]MDA1103179.1 ABC transporter permease [Gemmatimonadota bacterium]